MSVEQKKTSRPVSRPQDKPAKKSSEQPAKTDKDTYQIRDWASI